MPAGEPHETHRASAVLNSADTTDGRDPSLGQAAKKMCLQRPLSQLQERSLTWRLHKLAAGGDVRAEDIAELATLRQKQVGLLQEAYDAQTCWIHS